jgi:hypothetical protein
MKNELDDMKNLWQNTPALLASMTAEQIEALLTQRSKSALQSLRTNLLLEFGFGLLLTAVLLYAAFRAESTVERFAILQVLFVLGPCFIFYFLALKNLKKGISMHQPLRQMLQESIQFWQLGLKVYFWGGVLLLPVVFIAARLWRQQTIGTDSLQFFTGSSTVILFKALLAWALVSAVVWVLIKVSYGKYVDKLKMCLTEMDVVV